MAFKIDPSVLNSASLRLAVVGNNISNSGVTGFKGSDFSDVLASSSAGGGNGVRIAGSRQLFTQGTLQTSQNSLDMAINGRGFYQIFRPSDTSIAYTRDGSFNLDKDGYIVNPSGDNLQGYGVDAAGEVAVGAVGNLSVSTANSKPSPTSKAQMQLLLDSRLPVITAPNNVFNPQNANTYSSTTITSVYDKQGTSHEFKTYYVKTGIGTWDVYGSMRATGSTDEIPTNTKDNPAFDPIAPPTVPPTPATLPAKGATFHFSQDGRLDRLKTFGAGEAPLNGVDGVLVNPGAATQTRITFEIPYTDSSNNEASFYLDVTQTAQYASDFLASTQQDGYPTGQFLNVTVDKEGTLFANYSSGQSEKVGRVVLATFPSEINLAQDRNNQFVKTTASGDPTLNSPGKGGTGQVLGSNIETAGVDLTSEMIKLISAQRTYQANSEVVKRQDQVMQTIIGIGQ
jgi:flagellar hook protein FlgE